jgi:N-acetylglucosaminyldiphosphoundecaprenol N-acetyl-beta-D-mannosaminyltransferase
MWRCCERAAETGVPVYFYGGAPETLEALVARLRRDLPSLRIAGAVSPPFRPLTIDEDRRAVEDIARSGARIVFVGLGCPRQEAWMLAHRDALPGVTLGAGAAFDFLAGRQPRAPLWMREHGLEWLHRLTHEPRRLWRRYLVTNTLFMAWTLRELLGAGQPAPRAGQQPGGKS